MKKARIAVLVSGGGTNLQALIDAQAAGIISSGEITLVISNKAGAYALERAAKAGIRTETVLKKETPDFEGKLIELLDGDGIDLIVLAGFMSILSEDFTKRFANRIIKHHKSCAEQYAANNIAQPVHARKQPRNDHKEGECGEQAAGKTGAQAHHRRRDDAQHEHRCR